MQIPSVDVLIIGAGPIGLACALVARQAGLSHVIIDKGTLVNSLYNYPYGMTFFSTSEKLEIGGIPFVSNNVKPTRSEALEYYRRVAVSNHLNIRLFEVVEAMTPEESGYAVKTSKQTYYSHNVVVATGFYDVPNLLNIPGEDLPKVKHYYKEPHFYALQKVLIIGANNSAVDAALETYRKGAEVTMVIKGTEIGSRVKYWVKPDIENRIKEGSIQVYFNSEVIAIREQEVEIRTADGTVTLPNDYVLAMTGYQPAFDFLQKLGIQLSADEKRCPLYHPDTMETNLPHVYLAGVVCGGMDTHKWFIENSREHAVRIIQHIQEKKMVH